jgi:hypothetical protein
MNALVLDGYLPLQCTTAQLIEDPAYIFDTIRIALSSASAHQAEVGQRADIELRGRGRW